MKEKGTTNNVEVSKRDRKEEEDQSRATDEEEAKENSESKGTCGREEEEVEGSPEKARQPPGGPVTMLQGTQLGYPRFQTVSNE